MAALCLLVSRYQLLDIHQPPFDDVMVARYMLGRWPTSWKEVDKALQTYALDPYINSDAEFVAVSLSPQAGGECRVYFRLKNIFGVQYSETQTLKWSGAERERLASGDHELQMALRILADHGAAVQKGKEQGRSKARIDADVSEWNEYAPGHQIVRVQEVESEGKGAPKLHVAFKDGRQFEFDLGGSGLFP